MRALNNLLASPRFESWREGVALDTARKLDAHGKGKPRLSIIYCAPTTTSGCSCRRRCCSTKIDLMRRQPGTSDSCAALVYMER